MMGVDFGGVEVKSFDFTGPGGFETKGFGIEAYDVYDNTFEDIIFYLMDSNKYTFLQTIRRWCCIQCIQK